MKTPIYNSRNYFISIDLQEGLNNVIRIYNSRNYFISIDYTVSQWSNLTSTTVEITLYL